jgi:hypothetical protein
VARDHIADGESSRPVVTLVAPWLMRVERRRSSGIVEDASRAPSVDALGVKLDRSAGSAPDGRSNVRSRALPVEAFA